ncbi:MAG: hypothetical protein WC913_07595 [Desulfuromonas sp.]
MKTAHVKNLRLAHIGLGICYLLVLSGLLLLLHSLQQRRPQVEMFAANYAANIFEVRGKNLSPDTRLTLIHDDERCSAVVTTKFMWERVFDVKVAPQGDEQMEHPLAWALCRNIGLVALDIRNPKQPEIIHTIHIDKFLWRLEIQGDKAYIACGKEGIVICDISSVAEARVVANITLPLLATDVSVSPHALYVSNGKYGISVIDPASGEIIEHLNLPGDTLRVAYRDAKLFALGHHAGRGFLRIYSVPAGAQTQLHDTLEFDGSPRDYLFWEDPTDGARKDAPNYSIYLANGSGGVGIVKIAPDGSATFKGTIRTPFRSSRLVRYGDKMVAFDKTGNITIYTPGADDIFEPESSMHTCSLIFGAAILGDYAIIAASEKGIAIVDLRAGKKPGAELKATLPSLHDHATWKVTEHGIVVRHAKKIQYFKYLSIAGISTPKLDLTGVIRLPSPEFSNAYTVADSATGTWIYAVVKGSGLHVIRIGADDTLEQKGVIALPAGGKIKVNSCVTHADKLYLCSADGLLVFDISSPETPLLLTTEYMGQNILNITFGAQHAYISSAGAGVQICPIMPDSTLGAAVTIDLPEHLISGKKSLDTTLAAGVLYIASGYRGILSVDVRDPQHPLILDSMELEGYCSKVKSGNGLLAARTSDAVYLLDTRNPKRMRTLCRLANMQDFHIDIKNNKLLQLRTTGITSIPLPLTLKPASATPTRLEFHLPAQMQQGRYNIFINLDGIHSELVGSTTCTQNGAQRSECTFIPTKT